MGKTLTPILKPINPILNSTPVQNNNVKFIDIMNMSSDQLCESVLDYFEQYYQEDVTYKRISDILDWFESNYENLFAQFKMKVKTGLINLGSFDSGKKIEIFAFYLGGQYLKNIMGLSNIPEDVPIIATANKNVCYVNKTLYFNSISDEKSLSIMARFFLSFNIGIHEHTHALIISPPLTEIPAFYIQRSYGLPIKDEDVIASRLAYTCRDFSQLLKEIEYGNIDITYKDIVDNEYFAFALVPYIEKKYVTLSNISDFSSYMAELSLKDVYTKKLLDYEHFIKCSGIQDKNLIRSLKKVFNFLRLKKWKTPKEFIQLLQRILKSQFGNPKPIPYIMSGFVYVPKRIANDIL